MRATDPYSSISGQDRACAQINTRIGYTDPSAGMTRRGIRNTTTGGTPMRLDLSSVAYTLIFAGIAVWATSKLIRA